MTMRPLAFLEKLRMRFGDVFTVHVLGEAPWVLVSDPEAIRAIFKAPAEQLHAGEGRRALRPVLGDHSVLLLDEELHIEQRKLLLPPFSSNRVERYEEAMRDASEEAIEGWPLGTPGAATTWTRRIAMDAILAAVFGVMEGDRLEALRLALGNLRLPGNTRESEDPSFRKALAYVNKLVFAEIAGHAGNLETDGHEDVLSFLLQARHEDGSPMSDVEIRDELMSILVAGYETTATTLAWVLERLAHNPAALAQAEDEAADGGGPYIEAVIREALRLRPAVPLVPRAVKHPFPVGEHLIPTGVTLMAAVLLLHHRPDIYPDPASFRPDRFLERPPNPHVWLPFGGGNRRCIGARFALLEMRVVLSTLLAQATVRPADMKEEAMRCRNVTLTPARGAPVILERR